MCITGCVHLDRFAIPPVDKNLTVLTEHRVWVAAPAIDLPAGRRPQNPVNPRRKKYFRFPESQSDVHSLPFRFGRRGVSPTSRNVRRNASAAAASQGEAMFEAVLLGFRWLRVLTTGCPGEAVLWTAKSCGPGAPGAGATLATMLTHRADNGGKGWFTGESTYKP